ncbi:MAG: tRNA preQ1(34) S-adenosylmethionine ribosyltransferase-isomerase QueA [Clostridia bacterium]|nr:tRNA preQ1(34) S-adenosylmethionine ribosyltransferase-isomerase QueA [Clostridia bacterium]
MQNIDITKKSSYNYYLPQNLIAQTPLEKRDSSRMLCFNKKTKKVSHKHFFDIIDFLKSGDVLVINNTKVLPARLHGKKIPTGAIVEILLIKRLSLDKWETMARPFKRIKEKTILEFSDKLKCEILDKKAGGICIVKFIYEGVFEVLLQQIGEMPLPPYIKEKLQDKNRYQTVFSKVYGASAAPTAGLHLTKELLTAIERKGVKIAKVLLHVGLGTFRPVSEENILNHKMHSEFFILDEETADIINTAKQNGGKIISVGTTSVRVLETFAVNGKVVAKSEETDIFIFPGYRFKIIDSVITNFHLPESTLLMLVSAFCGFDETMNFYQEAINEEYRFFSFGDCCFLYED